MIEINLPSGSYLFVECDNDCKPIQIAHNIINKPNSLIFDYSIQLISTTKDITKEQAESIVFHHVVNDTKYYSNYLPYESQDFRDVIDNSFKTAKESLQSLIRANGLDINKNYLILKKL
jgi:hypothetical protein